MLNKGVIFFVLIILTNSCKKDNSLLKADADNGGLLLPDGFAALVVVDSVGASRHLAVNTNGDIYVKLRTPTGNLGNVALRDKTCLLYTSKPLEWVCPWLN